MYAEFRLDAWQLTDPGRQREYNEDYYGSFEPEDVELLSDRGRLYVVADGMGGHLAGEVASRYAVEEVLYAYYNDPWEGPAESLIRAIQSANTDLYEESQSNPARSGMGTTLVAAAFCGDELTVANVGDSRGTLVRDGRLHHITHDHSWVAEKVDAGLLTAEEARNHPHRNIITRSLGNEPYVEVDVFLETIKPGDAILLHTDGLSGLVRDVEMSEVVSRSDPRTAAVDLVQLANERGGPDNITVTVIKVQEPTVALREAQTTPLRIRRAARPRRLLWLASVIVVLLILAGIYLGYHLLYLRRGIPEVLPFLRWEASPPTRIPWSTSPLGSDPTEFITPTPEFTPTAVEPGQEG